MSAFEPLDRESATLPTLAPYIHPWVRSLVALGFLSCVSVSILLLLLTFKLIQWQIKSKRTNQFVILIFNLLWADIQQSMGFLLNVEWLRVNSVVVESPICFAQGLLLSTGDLGSGVWCFAIGLHTFASVILDYRLQPRAFCLTIVALWAFIIGVSCIPIGLWGRDVYVRSGIWCWIHHDLTELRLWTHYVWIFIFEFGNVIIYAVIYGMLISRIRSGFYSVTEAKRVKAISNLMVVYPIVYVICTLPIASARMAAMSGSTPSLQRLCLAGAMITSNGWLDVLLYTVTRRIMIFSDEPPPDDNGLDTFAAFWADKPKRFGAETTIEASGSNAWPSTCRRKLSKAQVTLTSTNDSALDLCELGSNDIKLVTTTQIVSEPARPEDFEAIEAELRKYRPVTPTERWSEHSSTKELELAHIPD